MNELQLQPGDADCLQLKNQFESPVSGITHYYYIQCYNGIEIHNAIFNLHFTKDGNVLTWGNRLVPGLLSKIQTSSPVITQVQAVEMAAQQLGYDFSQPLTLKSEEGGIAQKIVFDKGDLSAEDIPVRLMYQLMPDSTLHLAWDLNIQEPGGEHWWSLRVDAITGQILDRNDWVVSCDFGHPHEGGPDGDFFHNENCPSAPIYNATMAGVYNVFPPPVESPSHGSRQLISDPEDPIASPYGWHDSNGAPGAEYTITRGNNVYAQLDDDNNNNTFGFAPNGGAGLVFDFPIDFSQPPSSYTSAAITNLFFWNNYMHDFSYRYGFNELAGNFQDNNYGNGGAAGDYVIADAQDAGGTNNANFSTPPDGSRPRMQMYIWTNTNPNRDSDLDNGVIAHEYAHGISNRLTGGPSQAGCLSNQEQMGEGWSDYYALMTTMEPGDQGTDGRGIGTYLLGQPPSGNGIRPTPYSTNMAINDATYDDIKTLSVPHGIGYVWCTMIWDMTWDIISQYGMTAGFDIAMNLVNEGMKLQPCSPGFVDGRDAILSADQALYNGANRCLIWAAFARRGLGYSANQGSSGSRSDGTEAFDLPPFCLMEGVPALVSICQPNTATYTINIGNGNGTVTLSATAGVPAGATVSFNPVTVISPGSSTMTVGNTNAVTPGNYNITITGTGPSPSLSAQVGLVVHGTIPPFPTLLAPGNNASGITVLPLLSWSAVSQADSFIVQLASDAAFSNILMAATLKETEYQVTTQLMPLTQYFWRVKSKNTCGESAWSSPFTFTTANILCSIFNSTDVPVTIPTSVATVTSTLNFPIQGEIVDVNVKNLNITHTWISDLSISLTSPGGTSVTVMNQPCSDEDNILINFDDEAASSNYPCPPSNNGNYQPFSPLSAFDGQTSGGIWTLTVADLYNEDGGTLNAWGIEVCYVPFAVCDTTFIDSGGPSGNYGNSENAISTYCAANSGYVLTANFTSFETEANTDILYVYNGVNLNAPLIGSYSGSTLPSPISASNPAGCLTFQFVSDGTNTYAGWQAGIVCECPSPGNTLSTLNPVCSGQNFTLSLSNTSLTPPGFTFQWQSSPDGNTWNNISGATNATHTTSLTVSTWYRCEITCTNSGQTNPSVPLLVDINTNFCQCANYCTPTSGGGNCVTNVVFNTLSNPTSGCSSGNYSLQSATTTVEKGVAYSLSVSTASSSIVSVWIDYNQNGVFNTNEWAQVYTTGTSGTITITIPATAATGVTRMRIRSRATAGSNGSGSACTNFGSGETEDYCINIIPLVPCSGMPTPGNTITSANAVCSGTNFTLSLSGSPITGSGIQYQWQSSTDSLAWNDISGATNATLTTTHSATQWYRCSVTCTNSSQVAFSVPVIVNLTPFYSCYCASNATNSADTKIDSVFFHTIVTGTPASTCQTYTSYPNSGATFEKGSTYSLRMRNGSCSGNHFASRIAVYIDYNRNGVFTDAGELAFTFGPTTGLNTIPITNITIPATASTGVTGMRVILRETTTTPPACGTFTYGETEDYLIELVEPCQPTTWYEDADGDMFGNAQISQSSCTQPAGYVADNTDCDDSNSQINSAATEVCNGVDDNCDGNIDEGVQLTFFADADDDGFGDSNFSIQACIAPPGYVADNTDCDDSNSQINLAATETCNGLDDNCDGNVDEGVQLTFFTDADDDGFGDPNVTQLACTAPTGFVSDNTDCDDGNNQINSAATEVCNGVDDNCDGNIDEGVQLTFFADADDDGFGDPNVSTQACTAPAGFVADNTDCDDNDASIHPGAPEVCDNAADDNCNGIMDEALIIWTGNGDGTTWTDGANWDNGGAFPQACNDIVIPAGMTVVVPAGAQALGRTLEVESNAELVVDPNAVMTIQN